MAADIFDYDNLADLRYNSFTNEYSPKIIGYGSSSPEERTIPSTSPFIIKLFESPLQTVPLKTKITLKATSEILKEVAKGTTPANKQYAINYDELGNGQVLFNSGQAGQVVYINYYGLGTIHQRSTLKFSIFGGSTTKIVASSDSSTGSQTIADSIILTSEDFSTHIENIITELNAIGGGEIKILEGAYYQDTDLTIDKDNIKINGSGFNTKIISRGVTGVMIDASGANGTILENFMIDGDGKANTTGISGNGVETRCKDIKVYNCRNAGFSNCYHPVQCFVYGNNAQPNGFTGCYRPTACYAERCGIGFYNCNYATSCESEYNYNHGFFNCNYSSSCESRNNTKKGFHTCIGLTSCFAYSNAEDGYYNCDSIGYCTANANTGNGFDNCNSMGHNISYGNGTDYSASCYADYGGTIAVSDDAAGAWNG